jgi:N-carbamoylputrescine amidase
MKTLRVAAVSMRSEPGRVEGNLERMDAFAARAASAGAHAVLFPELSVTGYVLKAPETVYDGSSFESVRERVLGMAADHGLLVMAGLVEPSGGGRPYIAQLAAGPEGPVGVYRKTHLAPPEKEGFRPGGRISTFPWRTARFGIQLCYESHFPEISTLMALEGADVLFMPHASPRGTPEEKLESWLRHLTGRAFDNAVFIVACNPIGTSPAGFPFPGVTLFLGPDGRVLDQGLGEEEHILAADLDLSLLEEIRGHRMRYFLPHRRPDLYGPVTEPEP